MKTKTARHPDFGPQFARFTPEEEQAAEKIVTRALALYREAGVKADKLALHMNLSAVHSRVPLRLTDLADADDFNLMHDVDGIARHLNRTTGVLDDFFLPRFARRVGA